MHLRKLENLNKAVCREFYTVPSLEDIAPRLKGSTVFSKVDAGSGRWPVSLEESSQLLTSITPAAERFAI